MPQRLIKRTNFKTKTPRKVSLHEIHRMTYLHPNARSFYRAMDNKYNPIKRNVLS